MAHSMRISARLCWALDARPWIMLAADSVGAALFVIGCVAFYDPSGYLTGVSLFLVGSALMLCSALGRVLLRYGPSA